jgi:hypothetical protein
VKINIAHTPIHASLSDCYTSDTILARLEEGAPLNFQALGHFLSNVPKLYDLTYLTIASASRLDPLRFLL